MNRTHIPFADSFAPADISEPPSSRRDVPGSNMRGDKGVVPEVVFQPCRVSGQGACTFPAEPELSDRVSGPFNHCEVYRCRRCGHGVSMPVIDDLAALYDGRESGDFQGHDGKLATFIKRVAFGREGRSMLRQAGHASGTIVDFGCGSGLITEALADAATQSSEVIGMDFFPDPPPLLDKARYLPFERASELVGKADLVTAMHVLEHDNDPARLVEQMSRLLKPGGVLIAEVPNIDCPWRLVFGRNWQNWYLPYHRHHFNRRSFRALLESAGLVVVREHASHVPLIGRSIANTLGRKHGLGFVLASAVAMPVQRLVEALAGAPTALRVVCQKPDFEEPAGRLA